MTNIIELISLNNPVFKTLLFYEAILLIKMMAMSVITGVHRHKNNAFVNSEDAPHKGAKVTIYEQVERVRRAHLNDLENIPLFFVASILYICTNPCALIATNLIRIYTIARFIHTFVYAIVVVPQPARFLTYSIAYGITGYMTITGALYFCSQ